MSELYEAVVDVVVKRFRIARERVRPDATFDDMDLDSLSQIELATAIKKKFAVEITDDEMAGMSTVSQVVATLEEKLGKKGVAV